MQHLVNPFKFSDGKQVQRGRETSSRSHSCHRPSGLPLRGPWQILQVLPWSSRRVTFLKNQCFLLSHLGAIFTALCS